MSEAEPYDYQPPIIGPWRRWLALCGMPLLALVMGWFTADRAVREFTFILAGIGLVLALGLVVTGGPWQRSRGDTSMPWAEYGLVGGASGIGVAIAFVGAPSRLDNQPWLAAVAAVAAGMGCGAALMNIYLRFASRRRDGKA